MPKKVPDDSSLRCPLIRRWERCISLATVLQDRIYLKPQAAETVGLSATLALQESDATVHSRGLCDELRGSESVVGLIGWRKRFTQPANPTF